MLALLRQAVLGLDSSTNAIAAVAGGEIARLLHLPDCFGEIVVLDATSDPAPAVAAVEMKQPGVLVDSSASGDFPLPEGPATRMLGP
jgi:hypothetical protein